jgi:hypothetical protein
MSYRLDHLSILSWWTAIKNQRRANSEFGMRKNLLPPAPLFGEWRVRVQDIPSQECYNYLQTCGYECNVNGEVLLSTKEKDQYLDFIKLMGIEREL